MSPPRKTHPKPSDLVLPKKHWVPASAPSRAFDTRPTVKRARIEVISTRKGGESQVERKIQLFPKLVSRTPPLAPLLPSALSPTRPPASAPLPSLALAEASSKAPTPAPHLTPPSFLFSSIKTKAVSSSTISVTLLKEIEKEIDDFDYSIPSEWPQYEAQRGYTCGLYALATALKFGNPDKSTPAARKNGDKTILSLRQVAKEKKLSSFGEIFNVHSLANLAAYFDFPECVSTTNYYKTKSSYVDHICKLLKSGGTVIAACDNGKTNTPAPSKGFGAHWGLIFGYYFSKKECYFLTFQYGKTYLWPAEQLYQSNNNLPILNPKKGPGYFYHKNKEKGLWEEFREPLPGPKRYAIGDFLHQFRFGLCYVPSQVRRSRLSLDAAIANQAIMSKPR